MTGREGQRMERQKAGPKVIHMLTSGGDAVDGIPSHAEPAEGVQTVAVKGHEVWTCLRQLLYSTAERIPLMRADCLVELIQHFFGVGGDRTQDAAVR